MLSLLNPSNKKYIIFILLTLTYFHGLSQKTKDVNNNTISAIRSRIVQIDSTSFICDGYISKEDDYYGVVVFNSDGYNFIKQKQPDVNYPYGVSMNRVEYSQIIYAERGGPNGPYNELLYSLDSGKNYIKSLFTDAWSIDLVFVYENMVFLEKTDLKNKNKKSYFLTTDTFKTFIPLDWHELVGGRTFFRKNNLWRIGKQMGSGVKEYSWGLNAEYFESSDNGLSWKKVTLPVKYNFEMLSPDTFYTASRSKVYWSYNAGQTWDSVSHNMPANRVSDIWFANPDTGFAIMDAKHLYKTIDGGLKWNLAFSFDCRTSFIDPWDENYILFHSIQQAESNKDKLCIYRTTNGVSDPVGMQEIEIPNGEKGNKEDFTLYPNPANQSITLSTPNGANAQLSVYNLMGQLQYQNPNQATGSIDISQLATGLYIFELRQGAAVHRQRIEVVK